MKHKYYFFLMSPIIISSVIDTVNSLKKFKWECFLLWRLIIDNLHMITFTHCWHTIQLGMWLMFIPHQSSLVSIIIFQTRLTNQIFKVLHWRHVWQSWHRSYQIRLDNKHTWLVGHKKGMIMTDYPFLTQLIRGMFNWLINWLIVIIPN